MNGACVRQAWLALPDGRTIGLEGRGYFCTDLDLGGMGEVREVINNRPGRDGATDRTTLMGKRLVSANITALVNAGARIDEVGAAFAPFMVPSARPVLHYTLDRGNNDERTMTLRGAAYAWPVAGANERDIQLQWVAADPYAYGPVQQVATAWTGSAVAGRVYNRVYPYTYPAGSSSPVNGTISTPGDVGVAPYLRIYGPITSPIVTFTVAGRFYARIYVEGGVRIDAGHFLGVDCDAHTAYLDDDRTQSWLGQLDWSATIWPDLPPAPAYAYMSITGESTTSSSQVQATWHDRYLA